ncbi:MAG: hypothetical protein KDE53_38490 [Caldilineaceae bacterium]|nr:hypothetical protein [Caldilineaceae bacterium]
MALAPLGQLATERLTAFAERHTTVTIDTSIIMPNHVHLLLWLNRVPGPLAEIPVKKDRKFGDTIVGSLSTLIGAYKGSVRQTARNRGLWPPSPLWQDDFHDHIVRNDEDLARIRDYINTNPTRWLEDQLHPDASPNPFNRPNKP